MKYILVLCSLLVLSACHSSTAPSDTPVTLNFPTKSLQLTSVDSIASTTGSLSCGCAFIFDSIKVTGDTAAIHFSNIPEWSTWEHQHPVDAMVLPSMAQSGTHSAQMSFIVYHTFKNVNYIFYDTVHATYTK